MFYELSLRISPPLYKFGICILLNSNGTLNSLTSLVYEFIIVFENGIVPNSTKILMTKPNHSHSGKEAVVFYTFPGYLADVGPVLVSEDSGTPPHCKY